jgi:hypothetical protein
VELKAGNGKIFESGEGDFGARRDAVRMRIQLRVDLIVVNAKPQLVGGHGRKSDQNKED